MLIPWSSRGGPVVDHRTPPQPPQERTRDFPALRWRRSWPEGLSEPRRGRHRDRRSWTELQGPEPEPMSVEWTVHSPVSVSCPAMWAGRSDDLTGLCGSVPHGIPDRGDAGRPPVQSSWNLRSDRRSQWSQRDRTRFDLVAGGSVDRYQGPNGPAEGWRMTIMQSARRAKPAIDDDPWLSIDQLLEKYPFLQGWNPRFEATHIPTPGPRIFHSTTAGPDDCSSRGSQPSKRGSKAASVQACEAASRESRLEIFAFPFIPDCLRASIGQPTREFHLVVARIDTVPAWGNTLQKWICITNRAGHVLQIDLQNGCTGNPFGEECGTHAYSASWHKADADSLQRLPLRWSWVDSWAPGSRLGPGRLPSQEPHSLGLPPNNSPVRTAPGAYGFTTLTAGTTGRNHRKEGGDHDVLRPNRYRAQPAWATRWYPTTDRTAGLPCTASKVPIQSSLSSTRAPPGPASTTRHRCRYSLKPTEAARNADRHGEFPDRPSRRRRRPICGARATACSPRRSQRDCSTCFGGTSAATDWSWSRRPTTCSGSICQASTSMMAWSGPAHVGLRANSPIRSLSLMPHRTSRPQIGAPLRLTAASMLALPFRANARLGTIAETFSGQDFDCIPALTRHQAPSSADRRRPTHPIVFRRT